MVSIIYTVGSVRVSFPKLQSLGSVGSSWVPCDFPPSLDLGGPAQAHPGGSLGPGRLGLTHNFLPKPLLKMAPWTWLSDKNLNNGWYLCIAYLQGAKGTSSIFPPNPFFFSILILFLYLSEIISISLVLSHTVI